MIYGRERTRSVLKAIAQGSIVLLLAGCGPLITPESGPNSDQFPPEYALVEWTAKTSRDPSLNMPLDKLKLTSAGSIDAIRVENSQVIIDGWAPVTDIGVLWVVGFGDSQVVNLDVEGRWRPDVANAISTEFMGSGFSIDVGGSIYRFGDPLCIVAESHEQWFLLIGSDTLECGLSAGGVG